MAKGLKPEKRFMESTYKRIAVGLRDDGYTINTAQTHCKGDPQSLL
jgi:hypothetical protein